MHSYTYTHTHILSSLFCILCLIEVFSGWYPPLFRYIQWLIEEQESCDPHFHSLYALSLAKSAVELDSTQSLDSSSDPKISDQSLNSIFEQPIRERLQIFLQSSDLYDPEEVLHLIEGSELWLEKVVWILFYSLSFI